MIKVWFVWAFLASMFMFGTYVAAQNAGQTTALSTPLPTTNASKTVSVGGTFQTLLVAGLIKKSITIVNNNATSSEVCYIAFGTGITAGNATTAESIPLAANGVGVYTRYAPFTPADEIEFTCTSNGDTIYVDYQ